MNKTSLTLGQLILELPKLKLDPEKHEVNEIPKGLVIHFIDAQYMAEFEKFAKMKSKKIKLINYEKPAINLSFYEKHKYKLDKQPEPEEVKQLLLDRIDSLNEYIGQEELFPTPDRNQQKQVAHTEILKIRETIANLDAYEFAISNYYRNYIYMYVSFRYRTEDGSLDFCSEHLLNSEKDRYSQVQISKQNIIFIDTESIGEHTPYQNKKIEEYLKAFTNRLDVGIKDIFIKPKIS